MEHIQEVAPICMHFADNIVQLFGDSKEDLNGSFETLTQALETHGFCLSRSNTGYMKCIFNKMRSVSNLEVKYGDNIISQVMCFKYLGSVIQTDGEI